MNPILKRRMAASKKKSGLLTLDLIASSAVFDLDATVADSYPGSGTVIKNIIPVPADGESTAAYDLNFNGGISFGGEGSAAYLETDGSGWLEIAANTDWINRWHRTTGGEDFTLIMATKMPPLDRLSFFWTGQSGSSNRHGWLSYIDNALSPNFIDLQQHGAIAGGSGQRFRLVDPGAAYGQDAIFGLGFDHATNTAKIWCNSATANTQALTLRESTADAFRTFALLREAVLSDSGARLYAASGFAACLSDSLFEDIVTEYQSRHARVYL